MKFSQKKFQFDRFLFHSEIVGYNIGGRRVATDTVTNYDSFRLLLTASKSKY